MQRRFLLMGVLVLGVGLSAVPRARAVITRLTPLREVLAEGQLIFTVKVDTLDPDRPAAVFTVDEDLKGKAPFRRLAVNLKGDSEAEKEKHTPQLLRRLARGLPLVIFASQRGTRWTAFGYTNGTWFQVVGQKADDSDAVRWSFTHCEPYLRRTFKGTTAEMRQTIIDGLAGKKKPPEPDPKEPPGLGPEVKEEEKKEDRGSRVENRRWRLSGRGDRLASLFALSALLSILDPRPSILEPAFAVIPTVLVGGPLAILAMLFPALFGGLILLLRRWMAVLTVASLNSTLFLLHGWLYPSIQGYWWGTPLALWAAMTLLTLAGLLWAWRRHRAAARAGLATESPRKLELAILGLLTLAGLGVVIYCVVYRYSLLARGNQTILVVLIGIWAGTLYALYRRWAGGRPVFSTEGVMLGAMAFASMGLMAAARPRPAGDGAAKVIWVHEMPGLRGGVAATVLVDGDRVYAATADNDLFWPLGVLYCFDRNTREVLWEFNDDRKMQPVFSSPCVADGRLYIGEGFHHHTFCKLYCLDAATGTKLWHLETKSHTESSPRVVEGKVYVGAGDDGLYCVDAETGKVLWHFEGPHVDTNPVIAGNRLYGGSGYGVYEIFCLDKDTGKPFWREPVDLPAFATPALSGDRVLFGIGNGNLSFSDPQPRGALLCVDATTGKQVWRRDVGDGVLRKPAVGEEHVYCATRDRHCYAVRLADGEVVWKKDLGVPVLTAPALVRVTEPGEQAALYVIASDRYQPGLVYCLDPDTGATRWTFNVADHSNSDPFLISSPVVVTEQTEGGSRRRIYFGAELVHQGLMNRPAVYCLEEQR